MFKKNNTTKIKTYKGKVSLLFPFLLVLLFLLSINQTGFSQKKVSDTTFKKEIHSPKKAGLMSAILPGLGQVYNKQYWKVPVLYAGFATLTYFIITNKKYADIFSAQYTYKVNNNISSMDPSYVTYSAESLLSLRNYNERNYEFTIILTCGVYFLNIIDASVYGHLFSFDVGNDLSLRVEPVIYNSFGVTNYIPSGGLKMSLRF